jgi:hypothetical protein
MFAILHALGMFPADMFKSRSRLLGIACQKRISETLTD